MALWQKALIALAAVGVTSVFFINYCNLVFQCGCTFLWAGAAAHCNIHHGPKHCPFCTINSAGQNAVWLSMVIPQVFVSFRKANWKWPKRLMVAVLAFPVVGLIPAIILGLWQGYWN